MAERKSLRDTAFALVFALQTLFPPHPLAFSRLTSIKGTDKSAPVIPKAATYADYAEHLSPDAYNGVGAIGAFLGLSTKDKQGKSKWIVPFFVEDFDANQTPELESLIDTVAGFGLTTYVTC